MHHLHRRHSNTYPCTARTCWQPYVPTLGGSGDVRLNSVSDLASGVASPVTKCDDWLLDGLPVQGLPMEVGIFCKHQCLRPSSWWQPSRLPLSLGSPMMSGAGRGGILKQLLELSTQPDRLQWMLWTWMQQGEFERKQLEEECHHHYPADQEDDPTGCKQHLCHAPWCHVKRLPKLTDRWEKSRRHLRLHKWHCCTLLQSTICPCS